jgi:mitochondrial fission protein ELM1
MWPHRLAPFDAIIAPAHDTMPDDPRILRTVGSLHALTHATLEQAAQRFAPAFAHLPRPYVAVLIGGSSSHGALSNADIERLCDLSELLAGHGESGGSLLISTSRRTPAAAQSILQNRLTCPHDIYDWQGGGENPYLGLLALADRIVVTGDSISMCSEACFTGKPVFTFAPDQLTGAKHKRFLAHLHQNGHAAPLTAESAQAPAANTPLDEAGDIVAHLRTLLTK